MSDVPNHQVNRNTSVEKRGHVAMSGNLGYELDLTKMTENDQRDVVNQVKYYKDIRPLIQFGDFHRLHSPFEGNETAWKFVSEDKSEAVFAHFKVLDKGNSPFLSAKLQGLDPTWIATGALSRKGLMLLLVEFYLYLQTKLF